MSDNDQRVETVDEEIEEAEEVVEPAEGEEDTTDYKALAAKNAGIAKRLKTRLEKLKVDKKVEQKLDEQKKDFDYGQKAYLKASGIASDEYALVREAMAATGKDLESVLESKYFQAELKDFRDAKATKEATPSGQKRSTSAAKDSVEYWIAKGQLPPADQPELRRKVVNAKIKIEKEKSQFSDHPVV